MRSAVASAVSFTSARERRLWAWTAAVVLAIYATLGLARTLSDELRDRNLLDNTFFFAFLGLVGAVIVRALLRGRGGAEIFVILCTAIVYLMMFLRMASPVERSHLIEYGVVALLIHEALTERAGNGEPVRWPALAAIAAASVIGAVDELIQLVIPSRVFDPVDLGVNALAAMVAVTASTAITWARGRVDRA
ncbi:MAG: VanZ family protein [Acidimicrobiales bacterium]